MDLNFFGPTYIAEINNYEEKQKKQEDFDDCNATEVEATPVVAEDSILEDLMPIFGNNRKEAVKFLDSIKGLEQHQITRLVKQLVKREVISEEMKSKPLYDVLKKHNIYTRTIQNWNSQLI